MADEAFWHDSHSRQLRNIESELSRVLTHVTRMEKKLTSAQNSINDLTAAVQGVAQRVQALIDQSGTITALQTALDAERAQDASDQAALAQAQAATDAAVAQVSDLNSQIETEVGALNDIAPAPTPAPTPDPAPPAPAPDPTPSPDVPTS